MARRPPPTYSRYSPPPRRGGLLGKLFALAFFLVFVLPLLWVAVYRFVPPPATPLMLIRAAQGEGMNYRWRPVEKVSPTLVRALIAAEDARFCRHRGFDVEALEKAMESNQKRPGKVRGGSTISQQTAKNAFLWPQRSWLRKGVEVYFTALIEAVWGKRRIMEVYVNVAEWGPGVYGAQAAARKWFRKDADELTDTEAARLAAILPSPRKWRAAAPGPYVKRRSRRIRAGAGDVRESGLAACVLG
ncbi:MAG TPA: monofunctional biosynthetic peptidoglycan transglycosylase [Caulobacteraceae bacterium]|jgi:monofunctional biosynthetic peptidoglycan transglycosylase